MPKIYEATVAQKDGDLTKAFRFLDEAIAFVHANDIGGEYWIDELQLPDLPWLALVVEVINSDGGGYVRSRKTVQERREDDH